MLRKTSHRRKVGSLYAARGLTLVELMVSIVISLIIVLAATQVYLNTRESQRALDESSAAHEAGAFALKLLGRELMNAGFYPAVRAESAALLNTLNTYSNITGLAAYQSGIFGCEAGTFTPSTGACAAGGGADALVIGYFTSDAFGTSVGQRADCQGNDVASAGVNLTRVGAGGAGVPPTQPLFVANHYQLTAPQNAVIDGRTVTVRSLACNGNGSGTNAFTPLVSGIDDMQFTYGVYNDATEVPTGFYTATAVAGLGNQTINGQTLSPWQRVSAVRVCVIGRTYQSPAAIAGGAAALQYQSCDGTPVAQAAGDRSLRKTYVQVFGVRNRQTFTF